MDKWQKQIHPLTSKSKFKKNFKIKALQTSPFETVLGAFRRKEQLKELFNGKSHLRKRSFSGFENNEDRESEWIYDDNDLSNSLTSELLHYQKHYAEFKQNEANGLAATAKYLLSKKRNQKSENLRDRRASKNRVLRFDVHEKLMNFMAPLLKENEETQRIKMVLFGEKKDSHSEKSKIPKQNTSFEEDRDVELI